MLKSLQTLGRATLLAALMLAGAGAQAAVVVFTDRSAFQAAMDHTGTDQFTDLAGSGLLPGPVQRSAGALGYQASAVDLAGYGPGQGVDGLYTLDGSGGNTWLSTNFAGDIAGLRFSGFGAGTRGIGGFFFGTDFDGALATGLLNFTLEDQSGIFNYAWSGSPSSFLAFASDSAVLSLTISAAHGQQGLFATASALEIGVVPEPGVPALLSIAAMAMLLARRRQR